MHLSPDAPPSNQRTRLTLDHKRDANLVPILPSSPPLHRKQNTSPQGRLAQGAGTILGMIVGPASLGRLSEGIEDSHKDMPQSVRRESSILFLKQANQLDTHATAKVCMHAQHRGLCTMTDGGGHNKPIISRCNLVLYKGQTSKAISIQSTRATRRQQTNKDTSFPGSSAS